MLIAIQPKPSQKKLCPECGVELFYTCNSALYNSIRKNTKCLSCSRKGRPSSNRGDPYKSLYYMIKYHAPKYRNIECALTYEEFLEFTKIDKCNYCGNDIKWHAYCGNNRVGGCNLDRKDNSKGYSKDNCVVCCALCNYMKCTMAIEKFIQHCKDIVNYQQK